ncbi:hypothetical protein BASA81_009000 [Batrachochytrium salamandrivorans]|nr:hypothetical protein BASA81_009000 [Batrachochytrium salamandrivorans]
MSDPCFWISSLSSLNKLLLPGTLHFGSAIHADTFFIDCGADDVFMDAELADRLNIPLVKIPVPIKLRLADGDSSSYDHPSHSTPPVAYWRNMFETIGSMSILCHGIILGYSWLERHNPQSIGSPEWWILDPLLLGNCCVGSTRFKVLESLQEPRYLRQNLDIPEPESSDHTSDSAVDRISISKFI